MEPGSGMPLGVVTPKMRTCPVFDEEAVVWCANLLGIEVMRLKEILQDVSSHYREFWIRKRRGGYRMISAPDKELKAIQDTIYHRILLSVNVHPPLRDSGVSIPSSITSVLIWENAVS